jgi:NADH-quinone oxidoreductase subunit C
VDYLGYPGSAREARFEVIYHLASFRGAEHRGRIRIKVPVQEAGASIASAVPVYRGALWPEREVFDMFGILFEGHPDLRRILMPVNFRHHPLRKDYPLRGMGERDVIAPNDPGFVSPRETIKLRRSTDG